MTRTAGLHALADTLNTVQVGQLIVGEESQGDGCVEAAGHAAALARLVFEGHLHPVYGHGCGCAAPAKMRVQLTHRLLYELVSIPVHLQGQVPGLQVPQFLHLPTELGFLHLEATELCEDLGLKRKGEKSLTEIQLHASKGSLRELTLTSAGYAYIKRLVMRLGHS